MKLEDILKALGSGEGVLEGKIAQGIDKVKRFLSRQEKIRVFVAGSYSMGHQASTVQILYSFVDYFGYGGELDIVYEKDLYGEYENDDEAYQETERKLQMLFLQLPAEEPIAYRGPEGNVVRISFRRVCELKTEDVVEFGFTGGADCPALCEFLPELYCKFFLHLQPYYWALLHNDASSLSADLSSDYRARMEYGQYEHKKDQYIPSVDLDVQIDRFAKLVYKEDCQRYGKPFAEYIEHLNPNCRNPNYEKIELLQVLFDKRAEFSARLWPIYGLHRFCTLPSEVIMNCVVSALKFQNMLYKEGKEDTPVVMVMLNKFNEPQWEQRLLLIRKFLSYTREQANAWQNEMKEVIEYKYRKLNEINQNRIGSPSDLQAFVRKLGDTAAGILQQREIPLADRFHVVDSPEHLSAMENGHVYVLKLGGVARDFFNYLLYYAGLPPLFEGQGTSSFVMNLGKAYFQASLREEGEEEEGEEEEEEEKEEENIEDCEIGTFNLHNYPSLQIFQENGVAIGAGEGEVLNDCNNIALAVVRSIKDYCEHGENNLYDAETEKVAQFMWETYEDCRGEVFTYFENVRNLLQRDENEKLTQAMLYAIYCVEKYESGEIVADAGTINHPAVAGCLAERKGGMLAERMIGKWETAVGWGRDAEPQSNQMTLNEIYQMLQEQVAGREIDILKAFPDTQLARYGEKIFENGLRLTACGEVVRETEGSQTVKVVLEDGIYRDWSGGENHVSLAFTHQDSSGTVLTRIMVKGAGEITLPGVPWIGLCDVGFYAEIAEAGPAYRSGLSARLKGTDLEIAVGYPFIDQVWLVHGSFQKPQTALSAFYKVAGGVNFLQEMPEVLRNVGGFGLKDVVLQYCQKDNRLDYLQFSLETENAWKIVENPCFEIKPRVDVTICHVENLEKRQVQFDISGEFIMKGSPDEKAAVVVVRGQYPNFRLEARLRRGKIDLNDFVRMFGGTIDLKAQISALSIVIDPDRREYSLQTKVDTDWKIGMLFTVKNLGFSVAKKASVLSLGLSGKMVVLPGKLDMVLFLSADYVENKGWHFLGEQRGDGILQVGELLAGYLGWGGGEVDLPVLGLGFSMETASGAWEFSAKTENSWEVPFIKDMKFDGSLKIGKRVKEKTGAAEKAYGEEKTNGKEGADLVSYGRMEADILWQNVAITLWYDYDPMGNSFGMTWGVLEAKVNHKKLEKEEEWIAEVALKESITLGSIIETMISWIKGSGFGLEAPWDILDSIPLPKLKLIYNFTRKQIGFSAEIGEIDLGFAKITGIQVSYQSGNRNPKDDGVMVSLKGEFLWNAAGNCGDAHTLGPWDASEPGSAPAPSGQGNKYFDLRMLALGQHVKVDGISEVQDISQAIEKIGDMTEPEPGKLPSVKYDAASGWLVGMDFGVLKLTGEGENGYMLGMQAVWDDPDLYGLHFFLRGKAAKIFQGLEFEIMYKKLSDTLGVYQGEITLPDAMRHLELGAFGITLPVFAVAVYTNGDFQVDFGFPWGNDFTRSFALEAVIAPGIPLTGAAGFYFGKLSSETTDKVPACNNGTFRPVLVFGVGIQAGIGKSLHWGILEAGFSLTMTVILEGVIAKWNPYIEKGTDGSETQITDSYFYSIDGKAALVGKFYGMVDFSIIKASLNLKVEVYFHLTYANYQTISIAVGVSASVSLEVKINLGLFKITLSFSFSFDLNASFEIEQKGTAPWQQNRLAAHGMGAIANYRRVNCMPERAAELFDDLSPCYFEGMQILDGYLTAALTAAGDEWGETEPRPCYVPLLFLDRCSFAALCRAVAGWMIALATQQNLDRDKLDQVVVSEEQLEYLKTYVLASGKDRPMPLGLEEINRFVRGSFTFSMACPDNDTDEEVEEAAFFPMVPSLSLWVETEEGASAPYRFDGYNALGEKKLEALRAYFDRLAVQTEREQEDENLFARGEMEGEEEKFYSMASYIYADYFLLVARNMVQAMIEVLQNYRYPLKDGQAMWQLLNWINVYRKDPSLSREEDPLSEYTLYDIFLANQSHVLNHMESDGSRKKLAISGVKYQAGGGESITGIAENNVFSGAVQAEKIAEQNAENAQILAPGKMIQILLPGWEDYCVREGDSIGSIAKQYKGDVKDLVKYSNLVQVEGIFLPGSNVAIPTFEAEIQEGDTLEEMIARWDISMSDIAQEESCREFNSMIKDLFDAQKDPCISLPYLSRFRGNIVLDRVMEGEAVKNLGGMVSRYHLHGLRMDTEGIEPRAKGLWVKGEEGDFRLPGEMGVFALAGQQIAVPANYRSGFSIHLEMANTEEEEGWFFFKHGDTSSSKGSIVIGAGISNGRGNDIARIQELEDYLQKHVLQPKMRDQGQRDMYGEHGVTYPFGGCADCICQGELPLPYGSAREGNRQMRVWDFSEPLLQMLSSGKRRYDPVFSIKAGHYDYASRSIMERNFLHFGGATLVRVAVKEVPAGENPSCFAYEILGMGVSDTAVLAKALSQAQPWHKFCMGIFLGYGKKGFSGEKKVQFDAFGQLSYFIAQNNISTVTRPSNGVCNGIAGEADSIRNGVMGDSQEFVRLLWEACITNQGGFYLFYEYGEGSEKRGLPQEIFNEKGEAELTLAIMYEAEEAPDGQIVLHDYMNAFFSDEPMDGSREILYMQAEENRVVISLGAEESLGFLCDAYDADVSRLLEDNPRMPLREGGKIHISGGVYMADGSGREPGRSLADIARYFHVTQEELRAANPQKIQWEEELAPFEAIHLPEAEVAVEGGATLEGLAERYGMEPETIASQNMDLAGIFQNEGDARLSLACGSRAKHVLSKAGVLGMSFLADRPGGGMSAEELLLGNYTLLAYRILENAEYVHSGMGLPIGPRNEGEGQWKYQVDIPYSRFLREKNVFSEELEPSADNPYSGIGTILQMEYQLNDLYGNQMASTMTDQGKKPVVAGYTDALVALSSWPSIATWWKLQNKDGNGRNGGADTSSGADHGRVGGESTHGAEFVMGFAFQAFCYAPDASGGAENQDWYERAVRDLGVYETLYFQLLDINGICYDTRVSVLCDTHGETYVCQWDAHRKNMLDEWLLFGDRSVYRYLKAVKETKGDGEKYFSQCVPLCPAPQVEIGISLDEMLAQGAVLNPRGIYPLRYEFVIRRQNGTVMGDFENVPGMRNVCSEIAPLMEEKAEDGAGQGSEVKSLAFFARAFELAMRGREGCAYKIAEGKNREQGGRANQLWVVKQGQSAGTGIYFDFGEGQQGKILELPPLSNHLEGRNVPVVIPKYKDRGERSLSFSGIDLDRWLQVVLHSVEHALSPELLHLLRRLDDCMDTAYYQRMLAVKERLAHALSYRLMEVFAEEEASEEEKGAAREALYQSLLVRLDDYYNVQGAILLGVRVEVPEGEELPGQSVLEKNCGLPGQMVSEESPRLLGQMMLEESSGGANISLSQTKISLRNEESQPLACLVSAPEIVRDQEGGILSELELGLSFRDIGLEHQIGSISGIEGYQDSSWLKWVLPEDSLFRKSAAQAEMPVFIRNFPDTPKLEEQICVCDDVEENAGAWAGAEGKIDMLCGEEEREGMGIHWDYLASYARSCHYPQDQIHCHIGFNRKNNDCLSAGEGIFEAMARFVTLREELEGDLKALAMEERPDHDDPAAMYLSLAEGVAAAFEAEDWEKEEMSIRDTDAYAFSYDFIMQEGSRWIEDVNALVITVAGEPMEGGDLPEILVMPESYQLELVPEVLLDQEERAHILAVAGERQGGGAKGAAVTRAYRYRHQESGELLSAARGQQTAERIIKVGGLHLLRHQSVDFSLKIYRNAALGYGHKIRECFIYRTGDIGFGNILYPFATIDREVDMTAYGGKAPERATVTKHLQSFFQKILPEGNRPDMTVQLEAEYNVFVNESAGFVPVPILLQLPLDSRQISLDAMVQEWGRRIEDWYHGKIHDAGSTWRKGDRISFHLLFLSNETEESMPLLQFNNVVLPCEWIVPGK